MTPLPTRLRASAQEMRSLESIVRVAPRIAAELEEAAQAMEAGPVAWRVRGYAQFKTGEPGPWRYVDGPDRPAVNNPECCDFEPLYAPPSAQVAQEGASGVRDGRNDCATCDYKRHPDGGHCYMFRTEPEGRCAKHTARAAGVATDGKDQA